MYMTIGKCIRDAEKAGVRFDASPFTDQGHKKVQYMPPEGYQLVFGDTVVDYVVHDPTTRMYQAFSSWTGITETFDDNERVRIKLFELRRVL